MKKLNKILIIFVIMFLFILCSCNNDKIEVTFSLEGGIYDNSEKDVVVDFDYLEHTSILIYELNDLGKAKVQKSGYELEGWYTQKTKEDGKIVYKDRFDFSTRKVNSDITLYAKWLKVVNCTYEVVYYDNDLECEIILGAYQTKIGKKFEDHLNYGSKIGYTRIGYYKDLQGNIWDDDFVFPEADNDTVIKVYVYFVKGDYQIISTKEELKANIDKNIYLVNDIDFENEEISFDKYQKIFEGNGYKLKNITIKYSSLKNDLKNDLYDEQKKSLYISLFNTLENAVIRNIDFENIHVNIETTLSEIDKIYVSPLAIKIVNSKLENINITGKFSYTKLPGNKNNNYEEFKNKGLLLEIEKGFFLKDESSIIDKVKIKVKTT